MILIENVDPQTSKPLKDLFKDVDQRKQNRLVVLDPRTWTLLNGRDSATRTQIDAVLGLGPEALGVDFAASCVVSCVNTQRRDAMMKRARAAYAWGLAAAEVDPALDLHREITQEATAALGQLDNEIRRAFQHYAHLVRDANGLRVDYRKFEEDTKTSLSGNDVWEHLAASGDAVRTSENLAGSYLHKLLDLSDRNFTLAEVVEKFWRDPAFPMIPNDQVVRRAIVDALRPDEDGVAWELITSAGSALAATADQLLINSSDQYLRIAAPTEPEEEEDEDETTRDDEDQPPLPPDPAATYKVHELTISHQSLTDRTVREKVFQLLSAVSDVLDPSSRADVQVATIKIELNAAAGSLDELAAKASDAGATWHSYDEDF